MFELLKDMFRASPEPTLKVNLNRIGSGKLILNGHDLSFATCGIRFENRVGHGNKVAIEMVAPNIDLQADTDCIYFEIGGKRYRLIEETDP